MAKQKGWNRVGGGDFPPSFKFTEKGQWIEGYLVERRDVESDKFESGKATFYVIDVRNSSVKNMRGKVSIQGSGLLNYLLKQGEVAEGEEVRIVYGGMGSVKKGGKTRKAHNFELFTR